MEIFLQLKAGLLNFSNGAAAKCTFASSHRDIGVPFTLYENSNILIFDLTCSNYLTQIVDFILDPSVNHPKSEVSMLSLSFKVL